MKNDTLYFNRNDGKSYARISKAAARKAYIAGRDIIVCAVNMNPFHPWWNMGAVLNRKNREEFVRDETGVINDFNNLVNSYEFYNCINSETGKYAAFYMVS